MASSSTSSFANGSDKWRSPPFGGAPLPKEFFAEHTLAVAKALLGKLLMVGERDGSRTVSRIVETEAYRGKDPASHCARGRTPRASLLFGEPGHAYVYFIYGMYEMLNFVTEPLDKPGAVLIRAVEPIVMRRRRARAGSTRDLTNGPGKLCRALGIRMSDNGTSLVDGRIRVYDDAYRPPAISASPRVGISAATDKYWRYFITDSPYVSRVRENALARGAPA